MDGPEPSFAVSTIPARPKRKQDNPAFRRTSLDPVEGMVCDFHLHTRTQGGAREGTTATVGSRDACRQKSREFRLWLPSVRRFLSFAAIWCHLG